VFEGLGKTRHEAISRAKGLALRVAADRRGGGEEIPMEDTEVLTTKDTKGTKNGIR
jgi:hypothetical protein